MNPQESIAGIRFAVRRCVVKLFPKIRFGRAEMFFLGLLTYKIFKAFIKKKKNVPTTCQWCQRRANGANDVPTVPFLHVQKFGTKFSIVGAN